MSQAPNLKHYLAAWHLTEPQPLAHTATSDVYTVTYEGETVVLKLLTPLGAEERTGALALRYFAGEGAVHLLRADDGAHLLEYVDGEDLVPMVERGNDEQAARIIAQVLNQLHAPRAAAPPAGLYSLRRRFRSLFRRAQQDQQHGQDTVYVRGARLAQALLADQREVAVLHGDIHHYNIRHHARRGWLAFDPKGVYGERTYDAANTLCNPDIPALVENEARLLRIAHILAHEARLDFARLMAYIFAYTCLSACWSIEDGQDADRTLRIAALAEPHVRLP